MTITILIYSATIPTAWLRVLMIVKGYLMVFDDWHMVVMVTAVQ